MSSSKCACPQCPWETYRLQLIEVCLERFEAANKLMDQIAELRGIHLSSSSTSEEMRAKLIHYDIQSLADYSSYLLGKKQLYSQRVQVLRTQALYTASLGKSPYEMMIDNAKKLKAGFGGLASKFSLIKNKLRLK